MTCSPEALIVHQYRHIFDIFGWTFVGLINMSNATVWYLHLLLYAAKSTSLWFYCRLLAFTRASHKIYSPNTSVCKVNCNNMRGIKYSSTTQSGFCLILSPPRKKIATWDTQRLNSHKSAIIGFNRIIHNLHSCNGDQSVRKDRGNFNLMNTIKGIFDEVF